MLRQCSGVGPADLRVRIEYGWVHVPELRQRIGVPNPGLQSCEERAGRIVNVM